MADYKCVAKLSPENKAIVLELRDPTTGATVTTFGNVSMSLEDLTGTNKAAAFREVTVCVDGVSKSMWILATAPE